MLLLIWHFVVLLLYEPATDECCVCKSMITITIIHSHFRRGWQLWGGFELPHTLPSPFVFVGGKGVAHTSIHPIHQNPSIHHPLLHTSSLSLLISSLLIFLFTRSSPHLSSSHKHTSPPPLYKSHLLSPTDLSTPYTNHTPLLPTHLSTP